MNGNELPEAVMKDLLTVVLTGEASAESRQLIDEYARAHPEFAATMQHARTLEFGGDAEATDRIEMQALRRTKKMLWLKTILIVVAVSATSMILTFRFDQWDFTWGYRSGHLAERILLCTCALGAILGYAILKRKLRSTDL